jgi:hypothetical protein
MDKPDPLAANAADRNSGLAKRLTFAAGSREIDMTGRIHTDVFFSGQVHAERSHHQNETSQK